MSDFTHLPIPEGYRLVRKGYPRTGEEHVCARGVKKASWDYENDTHNIVEKIPTEEKPLMKIPKGWKFVANRPPLSGEWYIVNNNNKLARAAIDWATCPCDEECPLRGSKQTIVEPIIPFGWEFVDYRIPEYREWYVYGDLPNFASCTTAHYQKLGEKKVIIKEKKEEKKPMMNLESYSYTPKMNPITPRDIYGSHLEKIPAVLGDKWEVVDFRPVVCGDYYIGNLFFGISAYEPGHATSTIAEPRFIVKKLREITDTERMDWLCGDKHSGAYMPTSKNGAQRITRDLVDNEIREGEKKGN